MATVRHLGLLPECIIPSDVMPNPLLFGGSYYTAGIDLATLLKWYWRVKAWSVSASVTSSNPFTPGTVTYEKTLAANNVRFGLPGFSLPQDEKDLVCRRRTFFNEIVGSVGVFGFELFSMFNQVLSYQEVYYPSLYIVFDGGNGGFLGTIYDDVFPPGGIVTVDGITIPSSLGPDTTDGFITVTASEYWPYDPGDGGGPIYDSTTGQQLRAFPG